MSVTDEIKRKLTEKLAPSHLEIIDESHKHEGHAGHNGVGESHFRVVVVSTAFEGKGRVDRQKMVYSILQTELSGPVHALALKTLTADEFNPG